MKNESGHIGEKPVGTFSTLGIFKLFQIFSLELHWNLCVTVVQNYQARKSKCCISNSVLRRDLGNRAINIDSANSLNFFTLRPLNSRGKNNSIFFFHGV